MQQQGEGKQKPALPRAVWLLAWVRMFVILSKAKDLLLLLLLLFLSAIPRRESVANRFFPPINAGAPYLTAFFAERCGLFHQTALSILARREYLSGK